MIDLIAFSGVLFKAVVNAAAAAVKLVFLMFAQQGPDPSQTCLIKQSQLLFFYNNTLPQPVQTAMSK